MVNASQNGRYESFSNYTNGIGPSWGFQTWITEKGNNKIFLETYGTSARAPATETGDQREAPITDVTHSGWHRPVSRRYEARSVDVSKLHTDSKVGYSLSDIRGRILVLSSNRIALVSRFQEVDSKLQADEVGLMTKHSAAPTRTPVMLRRPERPVRAKRATASSTTGLPRRFFGLSMAATLKSVSTARERSPFRATRPSAVGRQLPSR